MIRCIPIDGSAPFEVENGARLKHELPNGVWMYLAASDVIDTNRAIIYRWIAVDDDQQRVCRIESWRERAERLEQELAISKAETALAEAAHRAALSSEGIGDMDLDEANAREKAALDQLEDLRRKIASDAMDERRLSEHG